MGRHACTQSWPASLDRYLLAFASVSKRHFGEMARFDIDARSGTPAAGLHAT